MSTLSNKNVRVVVTGMGVVAPNAIGVEPFTDALLAGRSGITAISHFDATHLPTRIAGEVRTKLPSPVPDRKVAFLLAAANEAWSMASAGGTSPDANQKSGGVVCGVGLELFRMEDLVKKLKRVRDAHGAPRSFVVHADAV